jgi:small conductance mechanosensitive channel
MEEFETVDLGVIDRFLQELPDKAFRLGLRVVLAILVLLLGSQLIKLLRHILKNGLRRSKIDESAVRFIDSFMKYALYVLLIILIASWLGVDAASIIAVLGSASVAIGLALQGSLSNFAGGVLLLILKPFTTGDYIKDALGNEGVVCGIDVFYTHLTTPDNKIIVLPNGTLANGCITNYTKCSKRRIDVSVGIAYEEDIHKAKEVLLKVLDEDDGILKTEERTVFVDSLAESSVVLNVRGWVRSEEYWPVRWRITENVKYALDQAGIRIPFPQMDIHFEKSTCKNDSISL